MDSGLKKKIENHVRKGRGCYMPLKDNRCRIIMHDLVLDRPHTILPWPFSLLQKRYAFIISVFESEQENPAATTSDKRFAFKDFNKAIDIFLKDIDNKEDIVFLGLSVDELKQSGVHQPELLN